MLINPRNRDFDSEFTILSVKNTLFHLDGERRGNCMTSDSPHSTPLSEWIRRSESCKRNQWMGLDKREWIRQPTSDVTYRQVNVHFLWIFLSFFLSSLRCANKYFSVTKLCFDPEASCLSSSQYSTAYPFFILSLLSSCAATLNFSLGALTSSSFSFSYIPEVHFQNGTRQWHRYQQRQSGC